MAAPCRCRRDEQGELFTDDLSLLVTPDGDYMNCILGCGPAGLRQSRGPLGKCSSCDDELRVMGLPACHSSRMQLERARFTRSQTSNDPVKLRIQRGSGFRENGYNTLSNEYWRIARADFPCAHSGRSLVPTSQLDISHHAAPGRSMMRDGGPGLGSSDGP
jgi:hypothetical protein